MASPPITTLAPPKSICICRPGGVSKRTVARASAASSRRRCATARSTVRRLMADAVLGQELLPHHVGVAPMAPEALGEPVLQPIEGARPAGYRPGAPSRRAPHSASPCSGCSRTRPRSASCPNPARAAGAWPRLRRACAHPLSAGHPPAALSAWPLGPPATLFNDGVSSSCRRRIRLPCRPTSGDLSKRQCLLVRAPHSLISPIGSLLSRENSLFGSAGNCSAKPFRRDAELLALSCSFDRLRGTATTSLLFPRNRELAAGDRFRTSSSPSHRHH